MPAKGSTPSTVTLRKSKFVSESDFHQNRSLVGPVTVVMRFELWLSVIAPLLAASTPSWETAVCGVHVLSPSDVNDSAELSSAVARVSVAPPVVVTRLVGLHAPKPLPKKFAWTLMS